MGIDKLRHTAQVDEGPASKDEASLRDPFPTIVYIFQHRLTYDEEHKGKQEPRFPVEEGRIDHSLPHEVGNQDNHRVTDDLWILESCNPLEGLRELPLLVL